MPKQYSEFANRKRTDNTMVKRKKDECTNNDRKIIKIEQHASHLKPRVKSGAPEGYLVPESSAIAYCAIDHNLLGNVFKIDHQK